ncbi:uncharacterized protein SPPG_01404 [Spizellomyces punctatus DAOM BR117]|uniref:Heme haloperoxidase family profile domain-containing protein n=1 Tax=Spizellomyces punctatus (strain DAOM BR117) TaxID=645134 RepID=A0A0L0HS54_SPIPD|nr:uncharacterized protein SPPG_01404 [Spizellomyces punctatus DAOM BR117]KND03953.1 hypothetical protein SPPG_01404 [Spizellomyces punctatus DAOM BR117]|eukprot:XP_016611992.1 hypothetical protein SPPG_01404 [Spizellomyces punctatus DAOM BR117]
MLSFLFVPLILGSLAQAASVPAWQAPTAGDVRSPCPILNALANHGLINRNGKDITPAQYTAGLKTIGCDPVLCGALAQAALNVIPNRKNEKGESVFGLDDLRTHLGIEHDASLTRNDYDLDPNHDNYSLNRTLYDQLVSLRDPQTQRLDATSIARARKIRQKDSKDRNPKATLDRKQLALAHGEGAAFLMIMGHQYGYSVPVPYAKGFFVDERLPFEEGWEPSAKPLSFMELGLNVGAVIEKELTLKN